MMKILVVAALTAACLVLIASPGFAYTSPNPGCPASDPANSLKWAPNPDFTDEFSKDDVLDTSRWRNHCSFWFGRPPSEFVPANVVISGGCLQLTTQCMDRVIDGSFEEKDLSAWRKSWGAPALTTTVRRWSHYTLDLTGDSGVGQVVTGLTPATPYTLYLYTKEGAGGGRLGVNIKDYGRHEVDTPVTIEENKGTDGWQLLQIPFTTGRASTTATVVISNLDKTGTLYVANVSLVPDSLPQQCDWGQDSFNFTTATACVQSVKLASFGYYEARMKVASAVNTSSFWLQNNALGEEIDVQESWSDLPKMNSTTHLFTGKGWSKDAAVYQHTDLTGVLHGQALSADWHVYGVDWEPDSISFYFDGKQVGHTLTTPPQQHPEYIYFDSEIFPFISMPDGPYTASMKVDYIRAWTRH